MGRTSRLVLGWLVLFAGCRPPRPAAPPTLAGACGPPSGMRADPRAPSQPARLCGRLRVDDSAVLPPSPGTLVLSWYRPEEQARFAGGRYPSVDLLDEFFERARIVPGTPLSRGQGLEYAIDYPGGPAVVLAVADFHHLFWETMFGEGEGNLFGVSSPAVGGRADVPMAVVPHQEARPERCRGDRFELVQIDAPEVAGTVGNDTRRRLCVWLPASYASSPQRRYPVVYLLPGFSSQDTAYLVGKQDLRPAAEAAGEVILVGVDTGTRHGSTYFTDSAAGGAWIRFVRDRMLPEIDGRYRTRADGAGRALVGHSTGGFNAMSLAIRFPELFGAVGASSPDALDFEGWLLDTDGRVRTKWLAWSRLDAAVGGMGQLVSYAAAWSREAPPSPAAFPFDLETGVLRPAVWAGWRAQSPLRLLDDPERVARVRQHLDGRLFIAVGKRDDFGLYEPVLSFAARLRELKLGHQLRITGGSHGSDQHERLMEALTFAVRALGAP
jgi:S-formylglutathione hydrolase FrmB